MRRLEYVESPMRLSCVLGVGRKGDGVGTSEGETRNGTNKARLKNAWGIPTNVGYLVSDPCEP